MNNIETTMGARPSMPPHSLFLSAIVGALLLSCSITQARGDEEPTTFQGKIVCSTTQIADFCRQVVGDRWEVQCVLAPGADPHMFTVTPEAIERVRSADICFDNGLHLEGGDWMRTLADQESKPIVSCTTGIKPLTVESADGDSQAVPDPHAWFSVANAAQYVRNINSTMSEQDPAGAAQFEARTGLYLEQLRALKSWIRRSFNAIPPKRRILVTSHDAFNYFCQDNGFTAQSPVGWSTQEVGAELTPARRQRVIDSIRESGVPAIFVETSVNPKAVTQLAEEAGVKIGGKLYSDSMGAEGTLGETYIGMMRENVITIVSALSEP
jgi:manganese/iron transport system substrate-binding protein